MNYNNYNPNQPSLGYAIQFGQQPQSQPAHEDIIQAQADNIRAITKINEANAMILEANVLRAKIEAMQQAVQLDLLKMKGIEECLIELRTAMATGKLVPVVGMGDKMMQVESAFTDKGHEALESIYMALYQKFENEAVKISKQ